MEIKAREQKHIVILDIIGEMRRSEYQVPTLHQIVKKWIEENKKNILVNFEKVKFIDSLGIGELVASFNSTMNSGGNLKLMKLPPKIHLVFLITGLATVFDIYEDEEAAVDSFV